MEREQPTQLARSVAGVASGGDDAAGGPRDARVPGQFAGDPRDDLFAGGDNRLDFQMDRLAGASLCHSLLTFARADEL
jgi:hypothetical protein